MADRGSQPGYFVHVHMVSDATGETLAGIIRAASAQFRMLIPIEHIHVLTRSEKQLEQALEEIGAAPGIVMYTMANVEQRRRLVAFCEKNRFPCVDVLGPSLHTLSQYLGTPVSHETGAQHIQDEEYHNRINALNFAMAQDDGLSPERVNQADVILLGVSRTSKTPTCVYLANRGIKAANVPIVDKSDLQQSLTAAQNTPLIVGLTISPRRLVQIRRNRLLSLNEHRPSSYINEDAVREEIIFAKRMFARHNWPVIDVTRRSIEETSAKIMSLLAAQRSENAQSGSL
ncbi:MAG: phosphoenolpyruvate synthase regulatory protein [Robiginitomaculum sp.]|nr:MAG: phosphoenolpyruvate synthase regulatory protein [Robiginitomaculum sp.]